MKPLKTLLVATGGVLTITCFATTLSTLDAANAAEAGDFSIIGHRGNGTSNWTENTIPSMRSAKEAGATAVEFDIRVTADNRFVVMHDAGLSRTTDCTGEVRAKTLAWIQNHCHGARHDERIPSLIEMIDWGKHANMNLLVELKKAPGWTAARIREVVAALHHRDMEPRAAFLSFSPALLDLVERVAPRMQTQAIISGNRHPAMAIDRFDGANVDPVESTTRLVARFHRLGMTVYGRVSNDPDAWRRFWNAGVDGLLTDRPAAAASAHDAGNAAA